MLPRASGIRSNRSVEPAAPGVLEEGLSFQSTLLKPGKLDLLYRSRPDADEANLIWWSPIVKAGAGVVDPDGAGPTRYAGGYVRPLLPLEDAGELILGALEVDADGTRSHEVQAEYRFPSGFGLGGGTVDRPGADADISFVKATYRDELDELSFILEAQAQETGDDTEPGGYVALYDDELLGVVGHDGEQWRVTLNYVSPENDAFLRPAMEGLYVDNSVGRNDGPQFLFLNGTLDFGGGFLSHPAALGRAMGPQGLEYGNPLGFLNPTWNRRLNTWELGRLMNWRVVRNEQPNGNTAADFEAIVFPMQFDGRESVLDSLLIGGSYVDAPGLHTPGALVGFHGRVGPFNLSITVRHEFETEDTTLVIGLIDAL